MANRKPLTDEEGEVREWTDEDFARAKTFAELPEHHQRVLKGLMDQRVQPRKLPVHLSREVVEKMQSTGEGWELRVEEAVRQWLARQEKRRRAS